MKLPRRKFLHLAAGAAALPALPRMASAHAAYPARPVRILVGFLSDAKMKVRLADLGATPFANSPAGFGKFIAEYTEKWAGVIRSANIKAE
jgi:tripartite-type tricarboxylate transporter receptor subunit TctC